MTPNHRNGYFIGAIKYDSDPLAVGGQTPSETWFSRAPQVSLKAVSRTYSEESLAREVEQVAMIESLATTGVDEDEVIDIN